MARSYSWKRYLGLAFAYFFGYLALFVPVGIAVVDGRALIAEAHWTVTQWTSRTFSGRPRHSLLPLFRPQASATSVATVVFDDPDGLVRSVDFSGSDTYLVAPAIQLKVPVVVPDTLDNFELMKWLEKGAIRYPESASPGEIGVSIVLAHSSAYPWYRGSYGSAFALIGKLQPGDEVAVVRKDATLVFQVSGKNVMVPSDFKVPNPDGLAHLTLVSCWPVRSNKLRMVVSTDLIGFAKR
jgi:LPXTG-site transpeptidase (sortase) family protein